MQAETHTIRRCRPAQVLLPASLALALLAGCATEPLPIPAPGTDTLNGAATGAIIGASVSRPRDAGGGALFGAVAGALLGAASDNARAQRAADTEQRLNAANELSDQGLDHLAGNYRRALSVCLQGRGYQTR